MPELSRNLPSHFAPRSAIDFRTDKRMRTVVLVLRLFSMVFFVPLFAGVPLTFRHAAGFDPALLWQPGFSFGGWIVPFLMMGAGAFLVVTLHEATHGAMLFALGSRTVRFDVDGITPRSYDEQTYLTRPGTFLYAVGPFMILSVIGIGGLILVPDRYISWVFLPTVVQAMVAAADFVVIAWLLGVPKDGLVTVLKDGCLAYADGPSPGKQKKKRGN